MTDTSIRHTTQALARQVRSINQALDYVNDYESIELALVDLSTNADYLSLATASENVDKYLIGALDYVKRGCKEAIAWSLDQLEQVIIATGEMIEDF